MTLFAQTTALFDLDGTLVDSADQIYKCVRVVRSEFQLAPTSFEEVISLIGLPADDLFEECSLVEQQRAVQRFRFLLREEIGMGNRLFPGSVEVVQLFRSFGWKIGVATSKPHALAGMVIEKSALNGLIDWTQGIANFPAKPDPTVIIECQKALPSERYLMFGDRPEDMIAGSRAGCIVVGIAQGSHSKQQLLEAGALLVFADMLSLHLQVESLTSCLEQSE